MTATIRRRKGVYWHPLSTPFQTSPPQRFCTVAPAPSCPGMLLNWHRFPEEPWCCVRDMNTQTHEHTHAAPLSLVQRGARGELLVRWNGWVTMTMERMSWIVRKAPMTSRSSPFFLVYLPRLGVEAVLVSTTRASLAPISLWTDVIYCFTASLSKEMT